MYLLDVSVLVALADSAHVHHDACHTWFGNEARRAWCTCPITQNGFVRVLSSPALITGVVTAQQAAELLRAATNVGEHTFIPDSVSLLSNDSLLARIQGRRQVTDVYLLALCTAHNLTFATLDRKIEALLNPDSRDSVYFI